MFRRFVLVASTFSIVALMALANPAGATSANTLTCTVTGTEGSSGLQVSDISATDGVNCMATLFFPNGTLGSSFGFSGMTVSVDKDAVHNGFATATGSVNGTTKVSINIASSAINPGNVAGNASMNISGTMQIRVW